MGLGTITRNIVCENSYKFVSDQNEGLITFVIVS